MKNLVKATEIVRQHLFNNCIHSIDLLKPDSDDELFFYDEDEDEDEESILFLNDVQDIKEEVSFVIEILKFKELSMSFEYIDFYFSSDGKSLNFDILQDLDEIYDLMKELMRDGEFLKSLQSFVITELRERKLNELSI